MSSEENYLDKLLNNVLEPKPTEPMEEIHISDLEEKNDELRISDIEGIEQAISDIESEVMDMSDLEELALSDVELETLSIEENSGEGIVVSDLEASESEGIAVSDLEALEPEGIAVSDLEAVESEGIAVSDLEAVESEGIGISDLEALEPEGIAVSDLEAVESEEFKITDIAPEVMDINDTGESARSDIESDVMDMEIPEPEELILSDIMSEDLNKVESSTEMLAFAGDEVEAFDIEEQELSDDGVEILNIEEFIPEEQELSDDEVGALNIEETISKELELGDDEAEVINEEETILNELSLADNEIDTLNIEKDISGEQSLADDEVEALNIESVIPEEQEQADSGQTELDFISSDNNEASELDIPDIDKELSLEENEMPEEDELKLEDIDIPEMDTDMSLGESELDIDGLDEAIQSETELEMAGELNLDELDFGDMMSKDDNLDVDIPDLEMPDIPDSEDFDISMSDAAADFPELSDAAELLRENAKANESESSIGMEDNLEDVLNMLDDDAELAEINDMLKKSDNNEPIQDDMMDLLHQMADDEAASVNAGIKHVDDDDDGVPLPEIPQSVLNTEQTDKAAPVTVDDNGKKKGKKVSAKKSESGEEEETKKLGLLGKFFNLLTEDLVPEPTEEELAAEKEAKAAKKQEEKAKKEEEKLANDETKKAKSEEKEAAKKAKQELAAQKKKEKQAEKEKKAAAKRAKLEAEGPKKRIPPKKIAAGAAFGATVGGALIIATNILSTQGFLQSARKAYYDADYKTVYQLLYDMELDENSSEGQIKAKSEVILKMQRWHDSYQINMKIGREVEALDALLQGITTYDTVNADAEKYEVMEEVDAIKAQILEILQTNYNLDETAARVLISNEDALSYTIALNDVINGN